MDRKLKLSEAKATFSAVVEAVANHGDRYIIERHGRPVAAVVSINDLERIGKWERPASDHPMGALALLGAWAELGDEWIDKFIEDVYASRAADPGRPVDLSGRADESVE